MKKPELLAPAGSMESFKSAIHAGANAIFLAGQRFGARAYAKNFSIEDIREAVRYAHIYGVSVFVVVNTLIFNDEIEDIIKYTDQLVKLNIDALIVQDIGLIKLLVDRYPNTAIHASTQVNAHHVSQVKFLKSLGVKRVILARETSLEVIKEIKQAVDIELEVFIHGALCVSYSGNCLMSSILNDRSGNRGACAYSCRLPYQLLEDGRSVDDESFLLSAKDLMTIEYMDKLIDAGIDSFKIEGRMRKHTYVAQSVLSYRKAIDAYYNHETLDTKEEINKLERVFNREYTKGYMFDETPKEINNDFRPNHIGVEIGEVVDYEQNYALIKLSETLENGDGFRIIGNIDYGNTVTFMKRKNQTVIKKANAHETIWLKVKDKIEVGSKIYKTSDKNLEKNIELYMHDHIQVVPLKGYVKAFAGSPLVFELIDEFDHHLTITSKTNLEIASKKPLSKSDLKRQFSKFGGTPFYMDDIEIYTDEQSFMAISEINDIRRSITDELIALREYRIRSVINDKPFEAHQIKNSEHQLVVKVHSEAQLDAAIQLGVKEIYYDDLLARKIPNNLDIKFVPVRRRIIGQKPYVIGEETVVNEIGSLAINGNHSLIADEFMNVTNIYSAALLTNYHVKRVTLSSELDKSHVLDFSNKYLEIFNHRPNLEMIVYGHKDLMISKYCPVAKTFGHQPHCNLCFKHDYKLKSNTGDEFALINDGYCNMRIMDSKPLNLIDELDLLLDAHIQTLRLDFTSETKEETLDIIKAYQQAINHKTYQLKIQSERKGHFMKLFD